MTGISERDIIETTKATIRFIGTDIIYVCYTPDTELEVSDFEEPLHIVKELSKEQDFKIVVQFPMHTHASPEARKFAMETPLPVLAEAIVFKSLAQRIIIRFYLLVNKQTHPIRIFTDKDEAVEWLNSL